MSDESRSPEEAAAIARLEPAIREPLYRMGWTKLHPLQIASITAIYESTDDLILSAQTAAGKTEAAFLPILSKIVRQGETSGVRAVYVGPLKALVNDQFLRVERLCAAAEIPVHKWHGDVNASAKRLLIEAPSGVLLITPESIESLFINQSKHLERIFCNLSFIVIDELHAFLGDERGAQLFSLIGRLARRSKSGLRIVGLSATLGNPEAAKRKLRPRDPGAVRLIVDQGSGKEVKIRVNAYLHGPSEDDDSAEASLLSDVFQAFNGKTALVFGNSKRRLEVCAAFAHAEAERQAVPNGFRIHHGSLSKAEREETEEALRSGRPTAALCSSTLEMGIDVGDVDVVGQVGPPWSVGSLVQRLGRSGRKDGRPRILRMFLEAEFPGEQASIVDRLYPDLLQGIAMVELLLAKWCEPSEVDRLHASTLIQQILSLITETGGLGADRIFESMITNGSFVGFDQSEFVSILRSLKAADMIEQSPEGPIVLGLMGEKVVRSFEFYSAFVATEEVRVVCQGREIGRVSCSPGDLADGVIVLGGRSWRVTAFDKAARRLDVEPGQGGTVPSWRGAGGTDIHPRVREAIRELLRSESFPAYLNPCAIELLGAARASAMESGALDGGLIADGSDVVWFTWTGSRINRTLRGLAEFVLNLKVKDVGIGVVFEDASESLIRTKYRSCLTSLPEAEVLAGHFSDRVREKYDSYLPDALLSRIFAKNHLDLAGAADMIGRL